MPAEGEGWYKPHYVFTRFVVDAALSVGFDAIRYPSVRAHTGNNIVVLNYEKLEVKTKIMDFKYVSNEEFLLKQKGQRGY
ncbi:RES family NAD+ phosphorylase [Lysinibacillus sp. NPDC059133]|uniref:RES family NAD+ phosphorylase n=1 Tax=Lysinibacillus sp. NPDC059133 TaxID=3346737 RepID=UPI00368B0866